MAVTVRAARVKDRFTVEPASQLFRSRTPFEDPLPSDSFFNTPVGSGMTFASTGSAIHNAVTGLVSNLNTSDWTDTFWQATSSDPLVCVDFRDVVPAGYGDLTPTDLGTTYTPSPTYPRYKTLTGIRIPSAAKWLSNNNSDRKVIVNMGFDCTLHVRVYNSSDVITNEYDEFYPAGTLNVEMHNFYRTNTGYNGGAAGTYIYVTNLSWINAVTDYGMTAGAIASGITPSVGYVRTWEAAAAVSDKYAIKHALKCGLANGDLLAGPKWPARTEDSPNTSFAGVIPYGTHIVLPSSFNVETFQVGGVGIDTETKAYLYALKYFGAYVLIRAGSTGVISFGVEPTSPIGSTRTNKIKAAITAAMPFTRVSTNSALTSGSGHGTYNSTTRQANFPEDIAGGGTRITAGLGLTDYDNTTGLKLDFNPAGPWV